MSTRKNRLPAADRVDVRAVERDEEASAEAYHAALLARDWSPMSARDRRDAVRTAKSYGVAFAKECDEPADRDAYVNVCVWFAFNHCKVINDVEFALWDTGQWSDPRIEAFIAAAESLRARKTKKAG